MVQPMYCAMGTRGRIPHRHHLRFATDLLIDLYDAMWRFERETMQGVGDDMTGTWAV